MSPEYYLVKTRIFSYGRIQTLFKNIHPMFVLKGKTVLTKNSSTCDSHVQEKGRHAAPRKGSRMRFQLAEKVSILHRK